MVKKSSLRDRAIAAGPSPSNKSWIFRIDESLRDEVISLVQEWKAGGDLQKHYPTLSSLCSWLSGLDEIPASPSAVRAVVQKILKDSA